ncbi:MAG: FliM/FliN family flagellar motor switch protein [Gammaproteobacteria bacterium]|nr:FliM/FliN family flagellar motor switch protein [Gammaproteobacteria bacterium]
MTTREILSEEETEALREKNTAASEESASSDGGVQDLHPDHWERIISDQVPALDSISERMVSLLKTTGRRFFRDSVEVTSSRSRPQRWGSYARKLPVPTSLNVIQIKSMDVRGVICLEADFVFTLIDIFFGGTGAGTRSLEHVEFTPMEVRLVQKLVMAVIKDMQQAWKPFMELDIEIGPSETNPIFASVAAGADPVSVSGFTFKLGEKDLNMEIVLPATIVEPIRFLRDSAGPQGSSTEADKWNTQLRHDVQDADMVLRAVLTERPISLRDLAMASPGDVIPIEIPGNIKIYADQQELMTGTFGVSKGRNAICINEPANRRVIGDKYGRHIND